MTKPFTVIGLWHDGSQLYLCFLLPADPSSNIMDPLCLSLKGFGGQLSPVRSLQPPLAYIDLCRVAEITRFVLLSFRLAGQVVTSFSISQARPPQHIAQKDTQQLAGRRTCRPLCVITRMMWSHWKEGIRSHPYDAKGVGLS